MAEERAQRRLAAILVADVVGYSRLMEQDEAKVFQQDQQFWRAREWLRQTCSQLPRFHPTSWLSVMSPRPKK